MITTSLSAQPGVVRVRSIANVLAEFLAHGEAKSADASGELAGAASRGLLFRSAVSMSASAAAIAPPIGLMSPPFATRFAVCE